MVLDECLLVRERENQRIITEITLLQTAIASLFDKKSQKEFSKRIGDLDLKISVADNHKKIRHDKP